MKAWLEPGSPILRIGRNAIAATVKSEFMTDTPTSEDPPEHEKSRLRRFEDAVHDRLLAAEVAAEEAAGYGSLTAAREAAETAANPEHELGSGDEATATGSGSDHPRE
jgi:hypothetical protein